MTGGPLLWEMWWLLPFMMSNEHSNVTQVVLNLPGWVSWQCHCCSEILLKVWQWFWGKRCYLKGKILNSQLRAITYFDLDFICKAAVGTHQTYSCSIWRRTLSRRLQCHCVQWAAVLYGSVQSGNVSSAGNTMSVVAWLWKIISLVFTCAFGTACCQMM